ncbi:MAG TPA: hypothetical protein VEW28_05030 [Candidatus Kapabacteria bacterium]|nr:hypothetical protein [Candidatus Kapabacteria bacterium]
MRLLYRVLGVVYILFSCNTRTTAQHLANMAGSDAELGPKSLAPVVSSIPLDTSHTILKMASSEWQFTRDFQFMNISSSAITLTDALMRSGDSGISVVSVIGNEFPLTLAGGGNMTVRLAYSASNINTRSDTLLIEREEGSPFKFPVQARHGSVSAVQNGFGRRQLSLTVTPNSSERMIEVKFSMATIKGNIGIYTTDGILVDEAKNVGSYIWRTSPKMPRHNENKYVVRATCTDGGYTLSKSETVKFSAQ